MKDTDEWLSKTIGDFKAKVDEAKHLSSSVGRYVVDTRLGWSTWIATRAVVIATNIEKLLCTKNDGPPLSSLDYGCVGSLCRDLLEAQLMLFYVSEPVPDDTWKMRELVINLHDCQARELLFRHLGDAAGADNFAKVGRDLKKTLASEPGFLKMSAHYRTKLIKGEMFRAAKAEDLSAAAGWDLGAYRTMVQLWSANIHCQPLSWLRMGDHEGGRGVDNERDKFYVAMSLENATQILESVIARLHVIKSEIATEAGAA